MKLFSINENIKRKKNYNKNIIKKPSKKKENFIIQDD
jgi:hypothetical protein